MPVRPEPLKPAAPRSAHDRVAIVIAVVVFAVTAAGSGGSGVTDPAASTCPRWTVPAGCS